MTTETKPVSEGVESCYCGKGTFVVLTKTAEGTTIHQCGGSGEEGCGRLYEQVPYHNTYRLLIAWQGFPVRQTQSETKENVFYCRRCGSRTEWQFETHRAVCLHPMCQYEEYKHGKGKSYRQNNLEDRRRGLLKEIPTIEPNENRFVEIFNEVKKIDAEIEKIRTNKL